MDISVTPASLWASFTLLRASCARLQNMKLFFVIIPRCDNVCFVTLPSKRRQASSMRVATYRAQVCLKLGAHNGSEPDQNYPKCTHVHTHTHVLKTRGLRAELYTASLLKAEMLLSRCNPSSTRGLNQG